MPPPTHLQLWRRDPHTRTLLQKTIRRLLLFLIARLRVPVDEISLWGSYGRNDFWTKQKEVCVLSCPTMCAVFFDPARKSSKSTCFFTGSCEFCRVFPWIELANKMSNIYFFLPQLPISTMCITRAFATFNVKCIIYMQINFKSKQKNILCVFNWKLGNSITRWLVAELFSNCKCCKTSSMANLWAINAAFSLLSIQGPV